MNGKKIIHIDMDAFYASIEQRDHPELRGKPIVVGGDPHRRGVVASASYEARRFGIRSAMSSRRAQELCPHAKFLFPNFDKYHSVSEQIQAIFHSVTSLVEPLSLDEAYLDVTENYWKEPFARNIAIRIKQKIKNETNLTASAGVGPNKFIAKVASDLKKPNGLVVVPTEHVSAFLEKLPVERFWGVGPVTSKKLHELGIFNAQDLRNSSVEKLERHLGSFGLFLLGLAWGKDDRPVEAHCEPKSRGTERTFDKDVLDLGILEQVIEKQCQELSQSILKEGFRSRSVTLKLRYSDFKTITRSRTFSRATSDPIFLSQIAKALLVENTDAGIKKVRLIGAALGHFVHPEDPEQLWLDLPI